MAIPGFSCGKYKQFAKFNSNKNVELFYAKAANYFYELIKCVL